MSEGLSKYIYKVDDEEAGAKAGFIKNEKVAEEVAYSEKQARERGDNPEEANRTAEGMLAREIGFDAGKEVMEEEKFDYVAKMSSFADTEETLKKATKAQYEAYKGYEAFQKDLDGKKLDELRAKMREDDKK